MTKSRRHAIVRQRRRKYWRGHVVMYRNSVSFSVGLPSGERRCDVLPTTRFWSRERRETRAEILAHLHLPGAKVPRLSSHYHGLTVSVPLFMAEVGGRLWRLRQPARRYLVRPRRMGARHG